MERRDLRLEERVRPGCGSGGATGRRLSVRQERLGETSGELSPSMVEAGAGFDILGRAVEPIKAKIEVGRDERGSAL